MTSARQPPCGPPEARARARIARAYLEIARDSAEGTDELRGNVAAGNAVLAAIAASDAICCLRLGRRHRGPDHHGATAMLRSLRPGGAALATALERALAVKDPAHYGDRLIGDSELKAALRASTRLVEAAEAAVAAG